MKILKSNNKKQTVYAENLLKVAEGWIASVMKSPRLKKLIGYVLIFLIIAIGAGAYYMFRDAKTVEAAWWNDSWQYRRAIPVTNSSATDQANVYISSTLDTSDATRFKANCGDLRFTKQNGEVLPYYIVSGCGSASTVVHVNFDILPVGDQVIYYYYGNPNAPDGFSLTDFSNLAATYSVGTIAAEEKGTGPVGYWSFDEGYGTTANDETANKNNGVLTNMSTTASSTSGWQTEDNCVSGKCLAFDGADDYVDAGNPAIFNFGTGDFTLSAWIKMSGTSNQRIFAKRYSVAGMGYSLVVSNGSPYAEILNDSTWVVVDANTLINNNTWTYVSATFKRDGLLSIYVNGVLKNSASLASMSGSNITNAYPLQIGGVNSSFTGAFFNGKIDEPKVYSYARSAAQIKLDYNAGLAGTSGRAAGEGAAVSAGGRSAQWLSNGLVGYWKMDEASWNGTAGEVKDWSGNGNNGVRVGSATTGSGKFGNGGSFAAGSDSVSLSETGLNVTTLTASSWVYLNADQTSKVFFAKYAQVTGWGFGISDGATNIVKFFTSTGSDGPGDHLYSTTALSNNTWYHIVVTFDGTTKKIYINGSLNNSSTWANAIGYTSSVSGLGYLRALGSQNLNGKLDDVRIYNRALSDREVRDLYSYAPGPVAYWNMEEGSASTVINDSSGNGNTGTIYPGTAGTNTATSSMWTTGKTGKGLKFDGVDDWVQISNPSAFNFGVNNFTISTWFNLSALPADINPLFNFDKATSHTAANYGIDVSIGSNGLLTGSFSDGTHEIPCSISSVKLNTWQYFVITRNGSTLRCYLDAVAGTDGNVSTYALNYDANFQANIVGRHDGFNYAGTKQELIDDFKIYNYARTPDQIMEDMGARGTSAEGGSGAASVSASGKTTVGYWKFDEGYGTIAHDSSPQRNNGTIYGSATSTLNGRFNKALTFDGVNDYVNVGTVSTYSFIQNTAVFAIGSWVKLNDYTENRSQAIMGNTQTRGEKGLYFVFEGASNDRISFQGYNADGVTYAFQGNSANNVIADNNWHYIMLAGNGSIVKFYIDGIQSGLDIAVGTLSSGDSTRSVNIGRINYSTPGSYLNGQIDEPKIYNYALTADEIKVDYNKGSALKLGSFSTDANGVASSSAASAYCVPGDTATCSAPIVEWKFEEGSGTTANDTSGNGNTGTWGGTGSHWAPGKYGKAGKFNGTDDYISINNDIVNTSNNFSFTGWINPNDFTAHNGYRRRLAVIKNGVNYLDVAFIESGNLAYKDSLVDANYTTNSIPLNQWSYIAVIKESGSYKIYVNGKQEVLISGGILLNSGENSLIGGSTGGAGLFSGKMDDVKIYNYARTQAQIAWDYNQGKPIAWWKMDECQGGTIHDSSGFGNNGTWYGTGGGTQTSVGTCTTSGTAWYNGRTGKRNASLNFDGTDDYVAVSDLSSKVTKDSGTVSFWLNHVSQTGNRGIFAFVNFSPLIYFSANNLIFFWSGATGMPSGGEYSSAIPWSSGIWHFGTVTWDNGSYSIYIDGILQETDGGNIFPGVLSGIDTIGRYAGTNYFNGQIDDMRIYNYALTASQVKDVYNGGAVRFGP